MTRRRDGFTLMELVVTIVITGAVTAMGYAAFTGLIDRRGAIRDAMVEAERGAALRELLDGWLARGMVQMPPGPDLSRPKNDALLLITETSVPFMGYRSALQLRIDEDPTTPARGLTLRYVVGAKADNTSEALALLTSRTPPSTVTSSAPTEKRSVVVTRELDPRITALKMEFLDRRTRQWFPASQVATIVPLAARMTLSGERASSLPPVLQLPFLKVMDSPDSL